MSSMCICVGWISNYSHFASIFCLPLCWMLLHSVHGVIVVACLQRLCQLHQFAAQSQTGNLRKINSVSQLSSRSVSSHCGNLVTYTKYMI